LAKAARCVRWPLVLLPLVLCRQSAPTAKGRHLPTGFVVIQLEGDDELVDGGATVTVPYVVASPRGASEVALLKNPDVRAHVFDVFVRTQGGPYDDAIAEAAARWRLDPFVLKGLLLVESELDPDSVARKRYARVGGTRQVVSGGAKGIAQFTLVGIAQVNQLRSVRQRRGEPIEPFTVAKSFSAAHAIEAAAELLTYYVRRFGPFGGITAYNSGDVGGAAVARYGFWRARSMGVLSHVGVVLTQGDSFLLRVLKQTNRLRREAGLLPLPRPSLVASRGAVASPSAPPERAGAADASTPAPLDSES
jgi:hypothetical protein